MPCNYLAAWENFIAIAFRCDARCGSPNLDAPSPAPLEDLLDYKSQREQARRDSVVRIARQSEELDDYDKFIAPEE